MPKRPTTAFVLSGGASLGAVQAGMLRALYEREIAPDLILGSVSRRPQRRLHRLPPSHDTDGHGARPDLARRLGASRSFH